MQSFCGKKHYNFAKQILFTIGAKSSVQSINWTVQSKLNNNSILKTVNGIYFVFLLKWQSS
jgi:hypothetical protein